MSPRALPLLACLLAAAAVLLAARLPDAPSAVLIGFACAWTWRVVRGLDGRPLVSRRGGALLIGLVLAVGLPYLFTQASGTSGAIFFERLLGVLACFLALALLLPLTPFGAFWIVLLATTSVAVTCALDTDGLAAALVIAYVALLTLTLLVLERTLAEPPAARAGSSGRVVVVDRSVRMGPALARAATRLVAVGVAAGLLAWFIVPRVDAPEREDRPGAAASTGSGGFFGRPNGLEMGEQGPDADTADSVLGAVDTIQADKRVHWEVRRVDGERDPPLLLREAAREVWIDRRGSTSARWRSAREAERDMARPRGDGWLLLGVARSDRPTRSWEARARLNVGLVFLEPEPLAMRVSRPTGAEGEGVPEVLRDATEVVGSGRLRRTVLAGDVVEMQSQPQEHRPRLLRGRESSARVAPLPVYMSIDDALAAELRELTRDVPGVTMGDAWDRASALERWLRGPGFEYELASPRLAPGRRVVDFLTRVKRGNCEWYATSLTLLLRAHGMASRYVCGYWGGSHTVSSDLWTFYGAHYHAWTEIYLHGVGWVPLNPTPPDRLAEGADPRTMEARRLDEQGGEKDGGPSGTPGERLRALLDGLVGAVGAAVSWPFSPEGQPWGWILVGLLVGLVGLRLVTRGRTTRRARAPEGAAYAPYLEALRLLAKKGHPRAAASTAREHLARVGESLSPEARSALDALTLQHERERYEGGRVDPAVARRALARLAAALAA